MPKGHKGEALLIIGVLHFASSLLIMPVTMALTAGEAAGSGEAGHAVTLLVRATKLLHFPLVTLAIFPREWFPGNWVYVPMALNSLIWALGICGLIALFRKFR